MSGALARLNLNISEEDRKKLRTLAKAAKKPEAVYARMLLVHAIDREEREELRRRIKASRSPELIARERVIVAALEKLRG